MKKSKRSVVTLLIAVAVMAAATPASSQHRLRPDSARARVHRASDGGWLEGTLLSLTSESLVIASPIDHSLDTLALRDVSVVEVSRGRRVSVQRAIGGALLGALAGTICLGTVWAAVNHGSNRNEMGGLGAIGILEIGVAIGGGIGLVVGGLPFERWEPVYTSEQEIYRREVRNPWP